MLSAPASCALAGRRQQQSLQARPQRTCLRSGRRSCVVKAHKVDLLLEDGTTHTLEVSSDESILSVALDKGILPPYDCQMGVCLKCAAKLVSWGGDFLSSNGRLFCMGSSSEKLPAPGLVRVWSADHN